MIESRIVQYQQIPATVERLIAMQPVVDLHTHLYPVSLGTPVVNRTVPIDPTGLMLWGVDELLTYHYLVAEVFRVVSPAIMPYAQFWQMSKTQQADHIWQHLFVQRLPLSEACRGVITALTKLGLEVNVKTLAPLRKYFARQNPNIHIDKVMELANITSITMTNAVFDDNERQRWLSNPHAGDPRFEAVLRIDPLLLDWPAAAAKLAAWGYAVQEDFGHTTIAEAQRFLRDWIQRLNAIYLAVSLPPEFRYPLNAASPGERILEKVVLPVCSQCGLPLAMMIGCRRQANPALRDAGDVLGQADVPSVSNLCRQFPQNRFLVTMLSRENQHELCVAARKFANLMPFGCWWFLNNPSLIEEVTRMRIELLGSTFIPQHSDARVLEQLLYKWPHTRQIISRVLIQKYQELNIAGRHISEAEIHQDAARLFEDNFRQFLQAK